MPDNIDELVQQELAEFKKVITKKREEEEEDIPSEVESKSPAPFKRNGMVVGTPNKHNKPPTKKVSVRDKNVFHPKD